MSEPLVTVLVVTYNHLNTFEKAIESVLEQRTRFDFKIWVLDDASTDGTSDLVRLYAERYPDKVVPIIRPVNLGGIQNVFEALHKIDTKYYATLESDDFWCDPDKLQLQVDVLEGNPDCSMCCHNTLRQYPDGSNSPEHNKTYIRKTQSGRYRFPTKLHRKQYISPHYSSRMYRTSCLNLDKLKNPFMVCVDVASVFWFLSFGDMYYIERVMSVYNFSYSGVYSGADNKMQRYMGANAAYQINREFDYKYNGMFLKFFRRYVYVSFFQAIYIRFFAKKEDLGNIYEAILQDAIREKRGIYSKTIFKLELPLPKRRKFCLELRRDKEM